MCLKIEESFLRFLSIEKKAMIKQQMIEELKKNKRALLSLLAETEAEANTLWESLRKAKKRIDCLRFLLDFSSFFDLLFLI